MSVAILKQGDHLIASIQSALRDHEVLERHRQIAERILDRHALRSDDALVLVARYLARG